MTTGKTWLDRRHPRYTAMADHWRFLTESYRGGPGWFHEGNLPKYPCEHPEKFKHRLAAATRDNYTREVVDQHTGFLFKQKPSRQGPAGIERFWEQAKQDGGDIDDLVAEAATESAKCGRVAIVIDKPASAARSAADDRLPYGYAIGVLDLLDFAWDEDGALLWVLTLERTRGIVDPLDPSSGQTKEQYRLRTREGWSLWEKGVSEVRLVTEGTWRTDGRPFGKVPVVIVDHQDSADEFAPPGLVDEIARIDRLIAQEQTTLHEIIEAQGAPTLTFPGEVVDPIKLGVSGLIQYSEASPTAPQFLTVPGDYISALQDRIDKLIDRLRELACLPTKGGANQSGESKKWDSQALQARLAAKAANLQAAEVEIARIVDLFLGGDGKPDVTVQYPSSFDVTTLADDVQQAAVLSEFPGRYSSTYRTQLAKTLTRKSLPDLDERTLRAIDEEIEATVADEVLASAAYDGTADEQAA